MLINCPLCKNVEETLELTDIEGKPLSDFVECPNCGYNTTIKTDLENVRKYHKDARMFDPLEFPESMPASEVINKRIEWARIGIESDSPFNRTREFEISLIENAPRQIAQLDRKIRQLVDAMISEPEPINRDRMNFERKILRWVKAVTERQERP